MVVVVGRFGRRRRSREGRLEMVLLRLCIGRKREWDERWMEGKKEGRREGGREGGGMCLDTVGICLNEGIEGREGGKEGGKKPTLICLHRSRVVLHQETETKSGKGREGRRIRKMYLELVLLLLHLRLDRPSFLHPCQCRCSSSCCREV